MSPGPSDASRFPQLTYTSFDRGDGQGGWQVKDTVGDLDGAEETYLLRHVNTHAQTLGALPQFPSPEEISARCRTLVYRNDRAGSAAYWHSIPAGHDAAGRPGNVFIHALVDRHPEEPFPPLRPVELWRSPFWLVPFGGPEVQQATLSPEVPAPGHVVDRDRVVEFLLDPTAFRLPVLAVLLDAVRARLDDAERPGPPVVLVVPSADEGALWLGAVSQLTSPGTARHLGFTIGEPLDRLVADPERRGDLNAVLDSDGRTESSVPDLLLVDVTRPVTLGELDGAPHLTAQGSAVPVTEWSVLAAEVLQDPDVASSLLASLEDMALRLGDHDLAPALPLALTVAATPETWPDAGDEAVRVLHRSAPSRLLEREDLAETVAQLLRHTLGTTAASAWDTVRPSVAVRPPSLLLGLALGLYAERVLRDEHWLARRGGVPPEGRVQVADRERARLAGELSVVLQRLDELAREPDRAGEGTLFDALVAVRAIDFADRSDLFAEAAPTVREDAELLVQRLVLPMLLDPHAGDALVGSCGAVAEATLAAFFRPLMSLELHGRSPGHGPSPQVLDWLFPSAPAFPSAAEMAQSSDLPDPLLLELAVSLVRRGRSLAQGPGGTPEQDVRPFALWGLLTTHPEEPPAADVAACFSGPPWEPAALRVTLEHLGPRLRPGQLLQTVLAAPRSEDLKALCDLILSAPPGERLPAPGARPDDARLLGDASALRLRSAARWWTRYNPAEQAQQLLDQYLALDRRGLGALLAADAQVSVIVALALRAIVAPFRTSVPRGETLLAWHREEQGVRAAAERLAYAVSRRSNLDAALAAAALATDRAAPRNDLREAPVVRALAPLAGGSRSFFGEAFSIRTSSIPESRDAVERDVLLPAVTSALQRLLQLRNSAGEMDELEKFAKSWCKENAAPSGGGLHGALSRLRRS
ncbi:MAG: hypothetical protein ACLGIA_11520 [Actinomycetes bacterium]